MTSNVLTFEMFPSTSFKTYCS